ncbi:MAG: ROK family protein [Bacteroidales bacterium]|nr:ROK family protein [Bacteroidales bacterium]
MKKVSVGIDIGGTNTVIGVVSDDAKILAEKSIPTNKFIEFDNYITTLRDIINELMLQVGNDFILRGIGIGAPNGNYYSGNIEQAPNLPWKGKVCLVDELKKYFDCKIVVTNDAKAATIGEMVYGGAKGMKNFVMITLGTGLGSGVVVNGNLVYGSDGFAGEFGHSIAIEGGRQCGCGKRGCLETYCSATGIKRTVFELICNENYPSKMRDISFSDLTSKDIYDFAKEGDKIALMAFDKTSEILGRKLADLVTITSPEAVFIFGGLANAKDLIIASTKKYMEQFLLPVFRNKVSILPSALLGTNIAVLGSAALVAD